MEKAGLSRPSVPQHRATPRLAVERRRRLVEGLHLQGFTVRYIAEALAHAEHVNPETGKPWGKSTIQRDVDALARQYKEASAQARMERVAFLNAQLEYLYRKAVGREQWGVALRVLVEQAAMLGLYPNRNARVRVSQSVEVTPVDKDSPAMQAAMQAYLDAGGMNTEPAP